MDSLSLINPSFPIDYSGNYHFCTLTVVNPGSDVNRIPFARSENHTALPANSVINPASSTGLVDCSVLASLEPRLVEALSSEIKRIQLEFFPNVAAKENLVLSTFSKLAAARKDEPECYILGLAAGSLSPYTSDVIVFNHQLRDDLIYDELPFLGFKIKSKRIDKKCTTDAGLARLFRAYLGSCPNESETMKNPEPYLILRFVEDFLRRMIRSSSYNPMVFVKDVFWESEKNCLGFYFNLNSIELGECKKSLMLHSEAKICELHATRRYVTRDKKLTDHLSQQERARQMRTRYRYQLSISSHQQLIANASESIQRSLLSSATFQ